MRFLISLLAALVIAALTMTLSNMFEEVPESENEAKSKFFSKVKFLNTATKVRTVAFGALYLLLRLTIPKMPVPLALLIVFATSFGWVTYLVIWWKQEGSKVSELILLTIINAAVMLIGAQAAVRCADISAPLVVEILKVIPPIAFVMSEGIVIADTIWFHEKLDAAENLISERGDNDETDDEFYDYGTEADETA